jgi:two-component system NtrC family sensor kinase
MPFPFPHKCRHPLGYCHCTGLGLSISHDIIVKQHAGAIEVDTQLGEFTEIRVILPRIAVFV